MRNLQRGFTLMELMTALLIVGILVALAVPTFREYTTNTRVTGVTNDLVTALNVARSEALRRATNATLCASEDGATCLGTANWTTGWIVYYASGGANQVVQVWPVVGAAPAILRLDAGAVTSLQYDARGMMSSAASATFSVSPTSCKSGSLRSSRVTVSIVGTVQTTKVACP